MTRGLRNCNPLNIRRVAGAKWKGQSSIQGDKEFVQFSSLEYGLRAAFILLRTYTVKYKAVCIEDIITRWAPPSENDTKKYIETVCKLTAFGGKERLTESQWPTLVRAMGQIECGALLSEEIVQKAYDLYKENQN
jgi:hypothetical protein